MRGGSPNRCSDPRSSAIAASFRRRDISIGKTKLEGQQCYYICAADGGLLSIAGVWDEWKNIETGGMVSSCSMIITAANSFMRSVHHQMPALLHKKDFEAWLNGTARTEVLKPADEDFLRLCPISCDVIQNSSGNDPTLITAVANRMRRLS
jgi:putative SOS response-associated peptidase YedK